MRYNILYILTRMPKAVKFFKNKIILSFKEHHFGKLKYVYERNGSEELIVVFSAFETVRKYDYMKTLSDSKIDKLFILDTFGYRGSYYWFEKGEGIPNELVTKLIERIGGGINAFLQLVVAKVGLVLSISV